MGAHYSRGKILRYNVYEPTFTRFTSNEHHFPVEKQAGRCVNSDGVVQIAGRIRLKLRADIAPEDLEQSCYDKCDALTLPEPTGCEFHKTSGTCFAYPVQVERGNGEDGFSCWIFEIAPGDCRGCETKALLLFFS